VNAIALKTYTLLWRICQIAYPHSVSFLFASHNKFIHASQFTRQYVRIGQHELLSPLARTAV
jgi:hypothetical protein